MKFHVNDLDAKQQGNHKRSLSSALPPYVLASAFRGWTLSGSIADNAIAPLTVAIRHCIPSMGSNKNIQEPFR